MARTADRPVSTVAVQGLGTSGALDGMRERWKVGARLFHSIFEGLIDYQRQEPDLPQKPMLATEWTQIDELTVELTLRELLSVFSKHGMTPVAPEVGETFDPQLHQAMFEAPLPGTKAGEIIQVMAEGFMLHDRLLRPAQVGVSSTPAS